jgi:hypothetical protein
VTTPVPPVLLLQSGQFSCPRCGPTNAVAQLVSAGVLLNPLTGFCSRCEHHYQFTVGAPSTTTTGTANTQGATAITVAAGAGFVTVGAFVVVDSASVDGGAELVTVSSAGSSTSIPIAGTPLRLTHAAGATVQTATLVPLGPMT